MVSNRCRLALGVKGFVSSVGAMAARNRKESGVLQPVGSGRFA